jgi:hypothetical protein
MTINSITKYNPTFINYFFIIIININKLMYYYIIYILWHIYYLFNT